MSVTNYGNSFTMSAASDERTGVLFLRSIQLAGTGMTAGDRLTLTDSSGGVLVDHYIENTGNENKEFLVQPIVAQGLKVATAPTGTWTVLAGLE